MRLRNVVLAGAAAAFASFSVEEAAAVSVSGVIYEGGGPGIIGTAPAPNDVLGDFSTATGNPILTLTGDTQLYGGVLHSSATTYIDGWSMDFGSGYNVVFNWQAAEGTPVDGNIIIGGVANFFSGLVGSLDLGVLTGLVTFQINPIDGQYSPKENVYWDVQATAVPLPAGGVLLLGALGGLALFRNRKNA